MSKELKIGLIGVFLIALLIWGINFLKGKNIFKTTSQYYAQYENIAGLETSSPVVLNGYKIGMVEAIRLTGRNRRSIVVRFHIRQDIKVPKNSRVIIHSSDILGTKALKLDFTGADQYYQPGDTLPSILQQDLTEQIYEEVEPIKDKAENLITAMDSILSIFDKDTRHNVQSSIDNFQSTSEELKNTSTELSRLMKANAQEIDSIIKNTSSISTNLAQNNENISRSLGNLSAITDSIKQANIKATLVLPEKTLASTDSILYAVKEGQGSMGQLITNDSLYNSLNETSTNLNLLIKDLKEHPGRYINVSVFGKKK